MKTVVLLIILLSLGVQSMTAVIAFPALPAEDAGHGAHGSVTESSGGSERPCHEMAGHAEGVDASAAVGGSDPADEHCADLCLLGVCCASAPGAPASEPLLWAPLPALGAVAGQPAVAVTEEPFRPPISTLP